MNSVNHDLLVSILCLTYNHKKYIRGCINSFLSQKIDFQFEILIHDDASDDGTSEILKAFSKEHEGLIQLVLQKENQFSKKNSRNATEHLISIARGKYIAFCDGDDYWIDDFKLQKQVNILENNPDLSGCVTNGYDLNVNDNSKRTYISEEMKAPRFKTIDLLDGNPFLTSSSIYKREILLELVPFLSSLKYGDYYIHVYSSTRGDIGYLNEISCVRRYTGDGIWSSLKYDEMIIRSIQNAKRIKKQILKKKKYKSKIDLYILKLYKRLLSSQKKNNKVFDSIFTLIIIKIKRLILKR